MSLPDPVAAASIAGLAVVPADQDKRPKVKWREWADRQQTHDEAAALGHGSLWAVITGELYGFVVLDFDGDEGLATMERLGLQAHVRTASGAHVYVQHPGHPVKSSAKRFEQYPGLDIKGERSLAFFCGRSKKGRYEPVVWPPFPEILEPALVDELFPHPQETRTSEPAETGSWDGPGSGTPEALRYVRKACQDVVRAIPGSSNDVLCKVGYSVGGLIAAGQVDGEYAYRALLEAAIERGAGDPEVVLTHQIGVGAERPWKFDPPDDEWIPLATARLYRQSAVPEVTPFPVSALPSPLDDFVRQGSASVSCPPDYLGAGILPVLGIGIGGNVDLAVTETWRESALVYACIVGSPGARKTPSIDLVMAPVWAAEGKLEEEARAKAEEAEDGWVEVAPPQLVVDDTTIEALFGVLERNPRGVILQPDELTGWVGGMGQYKGGLGRDRQHWLSIWSRRPIKVSRAKSTSRSIRRPFATVLGGIQPEPLEELLHGKDDGFIPRLLMARGEFVTPKLRRGAVDPAVIAGYDELWNRLRDEGAVGETVRFTQAGYDAFELWADEHYKTLGKIQPELAGAWAKMDGQAARLCLILARVFGTEVTPDVVDRAVALVRYFQGQAAGLLQGSNGGSPWEKQAAGRKRYIVRFLADNPGATKADIMASGPEWCQDGRTLDRYLDDLAELGIGVAGR